MTSRRNQIRAVRAIHTPTEEEAELWPGHTEHDERWPNCTMADCFGHIVTLLVCSECGYDHEDGQPVFRAWPCPTIKAIGGVA